MLRENTELTKDLSNATGETVYLIFISLFVAAASYLSVIDGNKSGKSKVRKASRRSSKRKWRSFRSPAIFVLAMLSISLTDMILGNPEVRLV